MDILRIRLPFQEQIEFFRKKLNLPTEAWDDIWQDAHDRAFVVAGAMNADLLDDLRKAVDAAIAGGDTIQDFRKKFDSIVAKHGWHGWTGEGTKAGEAWRTRVIYTTNIATSYAAGRWQQLNDPDLLKLRPYWRYVHNDSVLSPRPQHKAWGDSGLTLPHDHPFWKTHFPPNGWGCRCRVTAVKGPQEGDSAEPPEGWNTPDAQGNLPGIDKGWAYAPGRTWHPDLDKYPYETARAMVAENMKDGVFDRWLGRIDNQVRLEQVKPEYAGLSGKKLSDALRVALDRKEEYPVAVIPADKKNMLGLNTQVLKLSKYDAIKQVISRDGDPNFDFGAYKSVQAILDDPELIVRETGQVTVWFRRDGRLMVGVIAQTQTGKGAYLKSLRYGSENDKGRSIKNGTEIYRK